MYIYFDSLLVSSNLVLIIRSQFYQYNIWYMSLCVGDRPAVPSRPAYRTVSYT